MLAKIIQNVTSGRKLHCIPKCYYNSTVFSLMSSIPSNLHLANPDSILPEVKKIKMPSEHFFFPPLEMVRSVPIMHFKIPGSFAEIPADADDRIFGVAIRKDIVHEVVRYLRAQKRVPHNTKTMANISGSNAKPRPQKGTGQSQVGHKRNSAWRGGQKAHGPVQRSFEFSLNRKFRALGMFIVLAAKLREGNLTVFDSLSLDVRPIYPLPFMI